MKTDLKTLTLALYGLYAVSAVMQFSFLTMLPGCVLMIAAVWLAYAKKKEAAGTPFESHMTWLIRTFWIGTGVYLPVLILAETAVLYEKIDTGALMARMESGEFTDPEQIQAMLVTQYGGLMLWLTFAFTLPFLAWWLWRCWRGYAAARASKPVEKVESWI